jgi:hypothetical protein
MIQNTGKRAETVFAAITPALSASVYLLASAFAEIRFDGQLMGAVSQSHE